MTEGTHSRRGVLTGLATIAGVASLSSTIQARSPDSGSVVWEDTGLTHEVDPVAHDGRVYAATGSESIVCYDETTGERLWTTGTSGVVGHYGLTVTDGAVFAGTESGTITAFSPTDGSARWQRTVGGSITSLDISGSILLYGLDGSLGALVAETGAVQWPTIQAYDTYAPLRAGVTDGVVVFATSSREFTGVDLESGEKKWTIDPPDWYTEGSTGGIAASNGAVYVGGSGRVARIEASDGSLSWRAETEGGQTTGAAVADGLLVTAGDSIHVFDAETGQREYSLGTDTTRAVRIENGELVAAGVDQAGRRVAMGIELSTGLTNWQYEIDDNGYRSLSGVAVTRNLAFVTDEADGYLWAISRTDSQTSTTSTKTATQRMTATTSTRATEPTRSTTKASPQTTTATTKATESTQTPTASMNGDVSTSTAPSGPSTSSSSPTTTAGRGFFRSGDKVFEDLLTPWGMTILGFVVSIGGVIYQNYKND